MIAERGRESFSETAYKLWGELWPKKTPDPSIARETIKLTHYRKSDQALPRSVDGWRFFFTLRPQHMIRQQTLYPSIKERSRNYCPIVAFRGAKDDNKRSNTAKSG